ncbi:MAG TPA: glycine cleavage system protein GcvH [Firmicutes bacterium]|nr:MAG: glycine cleavage system protein GcvH [Candidatus Coatesbacteria bacterium]RLC40741.1 MAG: glycine cleavage system protein GcvH [Candidatus Coatesbacteria bacterium]RLC44952.1 MAG: glycine cleavage system protein GcvH [Candidatus Coatesbacteria bacterium]HDM43149.1 glycine cleavage system protein GcvH [Bacillota bacterium]
MIVKFTKTHEWIAVDDDEGVVGITEYAQKELGEIVYVEMREIGETVEKGEEIGVIESVKAASDVYAPVSGEIVEVNEELEEDPEMINRDAMGDGWLLKIRLSNPDELEELLSEEEYEKLTEEG